MTLPTFRAAAAAVARELNPWQHLIAVKLVFDDGSEFKLPVGVEPDPPAACVQLSDKQSKIIAALYAKGVPLKAETLARDAGYSSQTTLYQGKRGLNQLREMGLVALSESDGYFLTPDGKLRAAELDQSPPSLRII